MSQKLANRRETMELLRRQHLKLTQAIAALEELKQIRAQRSQLRLAQASRFAGSRGERLGRSASAA